MQILSRCKADDDLRPLHCRVCGCLKLHRHGTYDRGVKWTLDFVMAVSVKVRRYLCVNCSKTMSVLPFGLLAYRILSLFAVTQSLYDKQEQRNRDLLYCYRRRWEQWYGELRRGVGNAFGRLPASARAGWERLSFGERNSELVDRTGWSLFGRYKIHAPQRVF